MSLTAVNDKYALNTEFDLDSTYLSLTECIFVIDCPYTDPFVKGLGIIVIDQMHIRH